MGMLLESIDNPEDLRKLGIKDLHQLSDEIREIIISTVSKTGGHLAPSLGVVELTIAVHYTFNTPTDLVIWDVGHQSYAHKLLTNRRKRFHTLRQHGGISGFAKREESPYDPFGVGHSGTSISAALGMAEARCLKKDKHKVIAVIGDGALTAGMAFEGLNQAGSREKDLIVILNDNEMSISRNVGALSSYLSRILTGQLYTRFRNDMKSFLKTIPGIGHSVSKVVKKTEEYMKGYLTPGLLFEELGYKYVGPIEGHQLQHLINTFQNVRKLRGPILVHVITKKGKGYKPAEDNPTAFHGVGRFDIKSGQPIPSKSGTPSYTSVFGKTLVDLARRDERIVAITAAMPQGTGLAPFSSELPDRFFDVGIAEQHAVTFSAGLASQGLRPVVSIYSTFAQRAYDQILHDVCLQDLPIVLAMDRAGIVGEDGPTHHGLFDFSYLRHLPNMVVMAPKDERELQDMLCTAILSSKPTSLRYPRGEGIGVPLTESPSCLKIGEAEVLHEGQDLLIIAIGSTVYPAMAALKRLAQEHIEATVVNARFVKPLDEELICGLARKIKRILTVEENVLQGGFGSSVIELLADHQIKNVTLKRVGIPDCFVEHGSQKILRGKYGLDEEGIYQASREVCGFRKGLRWASKAKAHSKVSRSLHI